MSKDYSKGRGEYTEFIELKYIQIPHEIYEYLVVDMQHEDIEKRKDALWAYFIHYFTNSGYANLKMLNQPAYNVCKAIDKMSFIAQNRARWTCFEEFYEGNTDIDYYVAAENQAKKKKEKKKQSNKEQYEKRKLEAQMPKYLSGEEEMKRILKEKGIDA